MTSQPPSGTDSDRRFLWRNLEALKEAVDTQAALTLPEAVAQYVEAITGWDGQKLDVMLAVSGLNGREPLMRTEGAQRLGVSHQAVTQFVQRLWRLRDQARPPAGAWMPQVRVAERDGWPEEYTGAGVEATRGFFDSSAD